MTLHLVTFIYDFLCAECCVINNLLDRIKSNQIKLCNNYDFYGFGVAHVH